MSRPPRRAARRPRVPAPAALAAPRPALPHAVALGLAAAALGLLLTGCGASADGAYGAGGGITQPVPPAPPVVPVAPPPPPRVAALVVEQAPDTLVGPATAFATVAVRAADGTALAGRTVRVAVSDTGVLRADTIAVSADAGATVVLTARRPGRAEVTLRSEDAEARFAVVAIPVPLAGVRWAGVGGSEVDSLLVGDSLTRAPAASDSAGRDVDGAEWVARGGRLWSSDTAVVRVDAEGRLLAVGVGRATVQGAVAARAGGRDTLRLARAVVAVPAVDTVVVTPARLQLAPGATAALATIVRDARGEPVAPGAVAVRLTSSDAAVATVDAAGRVTARTAGTATLAVEAGWGRRVRRTTVPVTVEAPPPPPAPPAPPPTPPTPPTPAPSAFRVAVRYAAPVSAADRATVDAAIARWQRAITRTPPDVRVVVGAGDCGAGMPAVDETVSGILLLVRFAPIDGPNGTLGSAGPCVVRDDGAGGFGLPALGVITLDSDDLALMRADGTLLDVMTHEIGHTLGLGTLWDEVGQRHVQGAQGSDPQYVSPGARTRAARLGYVAPGATVPVENVGGVGSAGSHWRETVFGTELMSSTIARAGNPLSAVTIGALADLGYDVTDAGAEPAGPAITSRRGAVVGADAVGRTPLRDVLVRPIGIAGPDGRVRPRERR